VEQEAIVCIYKTKEIEVCSIDISPNAIEACNQRGLKNTHVQNILEMDSDNPENKFDTILLLMNGTGILEHKKTTPFYKTKSLLNPDGQILIDSSDIIYMFDNDEDGKWIPSKATMEN
jgi:2-polyprenyl-3-methyl-5-hydroxy-6-metoxy-1,4-benzoquinol methylase